MGKKKPSVKDNKVSSMRTICEVHREIYDLLIEDKPAEKDVVNKVIELLDEAYVMGKKMNYKLRQYKENYDDDWWKKMRSEVINERLDRRKSK